MRVFLVRHGQANPQGLTEQGKSQIVLTGLFLATLSLDPLMTDMLSSETPRAVETARIIQQELGFSSLIMDNWLNVEHDPEDSFERLLNLVEDAMIEDDHDSIILVTHEPHIKEMLRRFARIYRQELPHALQVTNGSVFLVDTDNLFIKNMFVP